MGSGPLQSPISRSMTELPRLARIKAALHGRLRTQRDVNAWKCGARESSASNQLKAFVGLSFRELKPVKSTAESNPARIRSPIVYPIEGRHD